MSLSHLDAKKMVDSLPGVKLTPAESLYLRAVAWSETHYGASWGNNSNNMGGIIATTPDEYSFKHEDSRYDDATKQVVKYTTWFAGDPTPEKGFARLASVLLKSNVRRALASGNLEGAVGAQYANGYFMGNHSHQTAAGNAANVADYLHLVEGSLNVIYAATGEEKLLLPKDLRPAPPEPTDYILSRSDIVRDDEDLRLRTLRSGMRGALVLVWQHLLHSEGAAVPLTGEFDATTANATAQWQGRMGLPPDGVVGVLTWGRMLR